jgi:hypothetical protein
VPWISGDTPGSDGPLVLIEVLEWCGCSQDPLEPSASDPAEIRDDIIVRRNGDGLLVQRLPSDAGAPCP